MAGSEKFNSRDFPPLKSPIFAGAKSQSASAAWAKSESTSAAGATSLAAENAPSNGTTNGTMNHSSWSLYLVPVFHLILHFISQLFVVVRR